MPPDDELDIKKEDNSVNIDNMISDIDNLKRPRKVWVGDYLWEKIRDYGKQNNMSISEFIRLAVLEKLKK